jgi:Domain of unknown function (DUF4263)
MNLLYTSIGYTSLESKEYIRLWQERSNSVQIMPYKDIVNYLHFNPASTLALIDAIVCAADTDVDVWDEEMMPSYIFPLETALKVADDVSRLPESCAMRDGRKWKTIPFIIICNAGSFANAKTHAHILGTEEPIQALNLVKQIVHEYQNRILKDYRIAGILVRFEAGRAQIQPAHEREKPGIETEYYYPPADRRKDKIWVTVKRDDEGLRLDVELFRMLLDRGASETEMHKFFEEHPNILMEARMGIPISHGLSFAQPKNRTPDFVMSPILGPQSSSEIGLLELKGPTEQILNKGTYAGFTARLNYAINQVRDYDGFRRDPSNIEAILQALGFLPDKAKLAVLIGRMPKSDESELFERRKSQLPDVEVVTYDDIFQSQAKQLEPDRGPYRLITEV